MDRIDALRLLIDVSDAGSFSGVARRRSIATSTVALAVSQLEAELGTRLLTRSTRQLVFTPEGETMLGDARRIVSEWDAALERLRDDGPLAGPLRVTATNDFGRTQVRPLLDAFQDRHPKTDVTLIFSDSALDLIEGRLDLAIRSGPLPDSSLRARLLVRGTRQICASPAYWARAGRPTHPRDLAGHNCIILARPGDPLAPWPFREEGRMFNVKVAGDRQTSDGDVLRAWAIEGRGVVAKNRWDIAQDVAAGRLETVLDAFAFGTVDLYAVTPGGPPPRRLATLVEFIADGLRWLNPV